MTAPATTLHAHADALASALTKHGSHLATCRWGLLQRGICSCDGPLPDTLTREEIDALVREIFLGRAQIRLLSEFSEKTAAVLDAFSKSGVKLERVDGRWMAHTAQGWTSGETVWDALQKATRIESLANQVAKVASRIAMADR